MADERLLPPAQAVNPMAQDPNKYWEDGFCGGSEYSGDVDLDRMIYPERPAKPKEKTAEQWSALFQMTPEERRAHDLREQDPAADPRDDREDRHYSSKMPGMRLVVWQRR